MVSSFSIVRLLQFFSLIRAPAAPMAARTTTSTGTTPNTEQARTTRGTCIVSSPRQVRASLPDNLIVGHLLGVVKYFLGDSDGIPRMSLFPSRSSARIGQERPTTR